MRVPTWSLLLCAGLLPHSFLPATAGGQTLVGKVLDRSNGAPVAHAWVTLVDLDSLPAAYAFTDTTGYFLMTAPEGGSYRLDAEADFFSDYLSDPVSLSRGDTLTVAVTLFPNPVELDELVVEARRRRRWMTMEGVYGRERSGTGWHIDRDRIESSAHFRTSQALSSVPGLRLINAGYSDKEPFFGGWRAALPDPFGSKCFPSLFINGMMLSPGGTQPTRIDRIIRPEEVEAIEVFRFRSEVPSRFRGIGEKCGVIAVWAR